MGILDRLKPQPRWKHVDPAIRLEGVRELDDQIELATLAESDPEVKVRRAALAKVTEVGVLGRVAVQDTDGDTRECAADRLVSLALANGLSDVEDQASHAARALQAVDALQDLRRLSTLAKGDAPDGVRTAALARISEARALGSIARHARQESTAAAALSRLTDADELREIALHSDHKDVALSAFERLSQSGLELADLRTIELRSQQKAVSRRAKAMIQDIENAEAARHAAALERQRRESMLIDAVQQLADVSDITLARADLARLSDAWAAMSVTEPNSRDKFAEAVRSVETAIVRRQRELDEQLELQRSRAEAIATRDALCSRVETLEGEDALEQLGSLEEEWRSLLPLVGNGPEADRLAERFAQAVAACRKRHEMSAALAGARVQLDALAAQAEALTSGGDLDAAAARWHELSREARGLADLLAEAGRPADDIVARMAAVDHTFSAHAAARQSQADQARQAAVIQVQRLIDRAKRVSDAETITLREGDRLMRDISAGLEAASHLRSSELDSAVARLRQLQEAVAPRIRELRELDDWRRFANAQRQEQLITMAEAIVNSLKAEEEAGKPSDLAATAKALRELHTHWQDVAEAPRQSAQRLWDRFRLATDFIRSRCEVHFQKLREERQAGLEKKTAIVIEAEALSASNDWAKTASRLQELQTEWQALGRVGRDAERDLSQRFRAACNAFFSRRREDLTDRKKVWTENLEKKEALCARAEELAASSDWDRAANEMKRLQVEWKTIGPVRKSRSEAIWNRFRAAADRFFERYHHRHEIALLEKLSEREAIVVQLEQLAAQPVDDPRTFGEQVQQIRSTWHKSVPVPVPGMKELTDRWQVALSAILAARPDAFAGTDLDPSAVVHRMEKLLARVEALVEDTEEETEEPLSQAEILAAKLRNALASNAMGGRVNEDAKWRAAADAVRDAQSAWQRLPPIETPQVRKLESRFRDACRRVNEHTRRHRQPAPSHESRSGSSRPHPRTRDARPAAERSEPREPAAV